MAHAHGATPPQAAVALWSCGRLGLWAHPLTDALLRGLAANGHAALRDPGLWEGRLHAAAGMVWALARMGAGTGSGGCLCFNASTRLHCAHGNWHREDWTVQHQVLKRSHLLHVVTPTSHLISYASLVLFSTLSSPEPSTPTPAGPLYRTPTRPPTYEPRSQSQSQLPYATKTPPFPTSRAALPCPRRRWPDRAA